MIWLELLRYWHFILANALSETRHRYAGTAMGVFWHVIQPLALIFLFSFIFAGYFPMRQGASSTTSSFLHIMSGMLPWLAFVDGLSRSTMSLTENAHYLRKLPLPESIFVARTAASAAVTMTISLALAAVATIVFGILPTLAWLTIPLAGFLMIGFAFGLGLILAPIHVFLRDTGQAVNVFTQFWMWLTPIVLAESVLPALLREAQTFNPAYWFVTAIRTPLLTGEAAPLHAWIVMVVLVVVTVLVGGRMTKVMRSDIRDTL